MTSGAPRPSVFVSSTIKDFYDLRDALKFWLEEMGFDVQMSEHTDFVRRPGAGSFEACFESIRQADYFLLLVGERRGSWFDRSAGLTVTREEYRVARESLREKGNPRILPFARRNVTVVLNERERASVQRDALSVLDDPNLTHDFLDEIKREEESQKAVQKGAGYPSHNWLAEFSGFRELTDALRSTLRLREPLARMAVIETLRDEMEHNLQLLVMPRGSHPFFHHWWLDSCRTMVQLDMEKVKGHVWLDFQELQRFLAYVEVCAPQPNAFYRSAVDNAITSGILLEFDRQTHGHRRSDLLHYVYELRDQLDSYERQRKTVQELHATIWTIWVNSRDARSGAHVPGLVVAAVFALHDVQQNVARLLIALLRYLKGRSSQVEVELRPSSPILGESEKVKAEAASVEQIRGW
ncbi:MAG TPA: DUF4062 domain-containing protein, partial [Dehalococcoidia bacterium]|nr:DUF4062 domain-containing protein [Dehalococcoidia bacterium]